jgi:lysophospholipase L1-like esterase
MRRCAVLLALLLLAGCTGGTGSAAHSPAPSAATPAGGSAVGSYVALGDSYTSAPYVYLTDVAKGCVRSDHNYPSLVAKALHVRQFRDVSCAGATTRDLTRRQVTLAERDLSVPPQLRAVGAGTDLVTLGIGGNDFDIFGLLLSCATAQSTCLPASVGPVIRRDIAALGPRLVHTLALVRRRAPDATVLLVGYPKIAPDHGSCPDLPGLTGTDLRMLNRLNRRLDDAMQAAARQAGAGYVDVYAASFGHDICARVPWVNGIYTDTSRAAAMHPFGVEQRAVARLVVRQLSR